MIRLQRVIGSAFIAIVVTIVIACAANLAAADERARMDEPFEITADRIHFDDARNLYVAEGHVRVDQASRRMKARWLAFSTETRIGVAEGDVELVDGPDRLHAEFMVFDVDTLHGMLFQGSMESGKSGFHVRAKELVRTGENTFTVRDGVFSTCRCDPGERLPWEIRSQDAEIEIGGYGTVKNATFNVLGVPVLWVPWAFFPIKSERETGLLPPTVAFGGRGGANVGLPFFWTARPQLNVILTPHYFAERGYKQDVELEYVFGKRSEGRLFLAGLYKDRQYQDSTRSDTKRWALLWEHDHELPGDWRWQTDLNLFSDNLYSDDFVELRLYKTFRFIESTSNVARDFGGSGGFGAMVAARYADDVQGSSFDDRDDVLLQRFAEARSDIQPGTLVAPGGIEMRLDSALIYFSAVRSDQSRFGSSSLDPTESRNDGRFYDFGVDGLFDDLPSPPGAGVDDGVDFLSNGSFQPGEPLAERGVRWIIHPRLARPFQLGGLAEFTPEVGWQQTLYRTEHHQFAERGLLTARARLRTRLARDYIADDGRALRHILEPGLGWALVSQQRQRSNPLFVPDPLLDQSRLRALSLESVTRNPSDRIESVNQLVLSLAQRFFVRDRKGRAARLRADLTTAVDWDFADEGGLGNLYVEGRLFPTGPFSSRIRGAFNPETTVFEEAEVGLNFHLHELGGLLGRTTLSTTYRYRSRVPQFAESVRGTATSIQTSDTTLDQLDWTARVELSERVRLRYSGIYSFADDSGFIRNRGILDYVSKCRCWGVGLSVSHEREQGYGGGIEFRFIGLGDGTGNLFDSGYSIGQNF